MEKEHSKSLSGSGVNAVGTVCSQEKHKNQNFKSIHARQDRRHLLESMNFWDDKMQSGLKSGARSKAKWKSTVGFWSNCAVSLVKQLWNGNLNDDLIQASTGQKSWDLSCGGVDGVQLSQNLKEKMESVLKKRPSEIPRGAAAIRRQQGVPEVRHPDQSGLVGKTPKQ